MKSMLAEDKSNLPCLSVLCVVLLGLPLVGEKGFLFLSVCFEPAQLPKLNLPSLVSGVVMV